MCVQAIKTKIGKAAFRVSCFIHYSLTDKAHVAHTGTFSIFTPEFQTEIEFDLNADDTRNLIAALQTHLKTIQQAQAELATSQTQAA
jgi:hypothetical protein